MSPKCWHKLVWKGQRFLKRFFFVVFSWKKNSHLGYSLEERLIRSKYMCSMCWRQQIHSSFIYSFPYCQICLVWFDFNNQLNDCWVGHLVEECLYNWTLIFNNSSYKFLPIFVLWGFWLGRKKFLFENSVVHSRVIAHNISVYYLKQMNPMQGKKKGKVRDTDINDEVV